MMRDQILKKIGSVNLRVMSEGEEQVDYHNSKGKTRIRTGAITEI
jgi:hypothetical protein